MKKQVYAYLHTHWDREWYRDKEDFNIRLLEVFDIVLDELLNYKAPYFYFDGQVIALLDYLKYRPERKKDIEKLIKEKKLAIGPYYVSADSYLIGFSSMLKNLEYGLEISNEFHQKDYIGYMADIFGISNSVFEALKIYNIDKALIWRGVNPEKIKNNCNFIKNEINTTWLVQGYFNDFAHQNKDYSLIAQDIEGYLDKISKYSPSNCLLPLGADHLGILKDSKNKIKEINKYLKNYEIILTSPFEYFKNNKYENNIKEKEFLDNLNTYILQGCYSSRINQKIKNNFLENKLSRIIEPLNYYLKDIYKPNIDFAYKTLIKNHAHDGICGCSLDSVHKSIDARQDKVDNIQKAILRKIIGNFKKNNGISGISKNKIGLFNLSNTDNIKTIKVSLPYILENSQILDYKEAFCDSDLYDIYKIPVTEEIIKVYTQLIEVSNNKKFEFNTLKIEKPTKKTLIKENKIENDFILLKVNKSKIEVGDKNSNKKVKIYLKDTSDDGDSYNSSPNKEKVCNILKTKIIDDGLIQSKLRIFFERNITIDFILNNYSKYLKCEYKINNKKKNHKVQFVSVLDENITQTISQDAIGIIKRNIDYNYNIKDFMPAKRPFELKTNCYPMQNFVNVDDFSILTNGQNEYEIYKKELKICLLRSFGTISNSKNKTRAIPAGPDLKTPQAQLLGLLEGSFAILFDNYKEAYKYCDILKENYVAIDGNYNKNLSIKLDNFDKNQYFCCINKNKKILYNVMKEKIEMI